MRPGDKIILLTTFECIFLLLSFFFGGVIVGISRFTDAWDESTDELIEIAWGLRKIVGATAATVESLEKLLNQEVRKKKWDRVMEWGRVGWSVEVDCIDTV